MRMLQPAAIAALTLAAPAWADWAVTNKDAASYELKTRCGSASEDWWISGGVTKPSSIAEGRSCTVTMKKGGGSCTVKDNQTCVIRAGRLSKGGAHRG